MRYLPSFKALRCFEATVRTGTLSAAARELNVTPGAVSRQISALEEHLGAPLMLRHRRGATASSQGRTLADKLARAFSDIGEALDEVAAMPDDQTVTLNVYPTFAIQWLMPRLPDFYGLAPDVDLRIRPSLQEHPFDREEIDVAILIGVPSDHRLSSRVLFRRRFTPVCSPATLRAVGPLPPADIGKCQIFYSEMHVRQWRMWLEAVGLAAVELPATGIRFENSSLAYQAAREGTGFAIGQPTLLRADLESGRLVAPFAIVVEGNRQYAVACRARDAGRPSVRLFMDWITKAAAECDSRT